MHDCWRVAGRKARKQYACCFGAQGCTHPLWLNKTGISSIARSNGEGQKQESDSSQASQSVTLSSSNDASLDDLFHVLTVFLDVGWDVSVTAQVTPASRHSLSAIREQYTSLMEVFHRTGSVGYLDAAGLCLKNIIAKSKKKDYQCPYDKSKFASKKALQKHMAKMHRTRR